MSSFTVNTFPTCATRVADVVAEALQADATTRFGVGIRIEGDESTWRLVVCVFFFWGSVCSGVGSHELVEFGGAGTRIHRRWV